MSKARQLADLGNVYDDGALSNRNRIINGNFGINQRAVSGTVVLGAGAYGHDRWKAGASGCTYTFATSGNVTTITVSAGSLVQVVEGVNLQSGTHVLSWAGTVQMTIDAGSAGNTGMTGTLTGGTNATIETSGTGTLSLVQLELGDTATPFEHRSYGQELALCQRYFLMWRPEGTGVTNYPGVGFGYVASATTHIIGIKAPVTLRATPTVSFTGTLILTTGSTSSGNLSSVANVYQPGPDGFWINCTNTAGTATFGYGSLLYLANSTANSFSASAEL